MSDSVPAAMAASSAIVILAMACVTTQPAPIKTSPSPAATAPGAVAQSSGNAPARLGGARPVVSDSARRVRDSLTSARRDSAQANLLRQIAGRENEPAEKVFRNVQIFQGVPAGRVVRIMNAGFGRSLGVSCGFCHVPGQWEKDDKREKEVARTMFRMVNAINRDYMSKVPNDRGAPAVVNCMTCHQGSPRPVSADASAPRAAPGTE